MVLFLTFMHQMYTSNCSLLPEASLYRDVEVRWGRENALVYIMCFKFWLIYPEVQVVLTSAKAAFTANAIILHLS